jgi:hypothetical protein
MPDQGFFSVINTALGLLSFSMVGIMAWRFSATSTKVEAMWAWFLTERIKEKWNGIDRRASK